MLWTMLRMPNLNVTKNFIWIFKIVIMIFEKSNEIWKTNENKTKQQDIATSYFDQEC